MTLVRKVSSYGEEKHIWIYISTFSSSWWMLCIFATLFWNCVNVSGDVWGQYRCFLKASFMLVSKRIHIQHVYRSSSSPLTARVVGFPDERISINNRWGCFVFKFWKHKRGDFKNVLVLFFKVLTKLLILQTNVTLKPADHRQEESPEVRVQSRLFGGCIILSL